MLTRKDVKDLKEGQIIYSAYKGFLLWDDIRCLKIVSTKEKLKLINDESKRLNLIVTKKDILYDMRYRAYKFFKTARQAFKYIEDEE